MKNSAENSAPHRDKRGRLRGGNPGNRGGQKGRSGRPPSEFREWALTLRESAVREVIEEILGDPSHRDRFRAVEFVTKQAEGAERLVSLDFALRMAEEVIDVVARHLPEDRFPAFMDDLGRSLGQYYPEPRDAPPALMQGD